MNMMAKGPTIRLNRTPGRRRTSRSSLPVKEPMRTTLWTRSRIRHRPSLGCVIAGGATRSTSLLHQAGEHFVEGRLVLLDAVDVHAAAAQRVDELRRQRRGVVDG